MAACPSFCVLCLKRAARTRALRASHGGGAAPLSGNAAHAAVSTVVALLRRRRLTPFAGLANAVLRRVAREGAELEAGLDYERLDIPPWL